jgi:hypothetical protein
VAVGRLEALQLAQQQGCCQPGVRGTAACAAAAHAEARPERPVRHHRGGVAGEDPVAAGAQEAHLAWEGAPQQRGANFYWVNIG